MLTLNASIGHVRPGLLRGSVFQADWIAACKGQRDNFAEGSSTKTQCDFDYSGTMMEEMLLALVAHRVGKKIQYDPTAGRITNVPEANDYLKRQYRPGWTLTADLGGLGGLDVPAGQPFRLVGGSLLRNPTSSRLCPLLFDILQRACQGRFRSVSELRLHR